MGNAMTDCLTLIHAIPVRNVARIATLATHALTINNANHDIEDILGKVILECNCLILVCVCPNLTPTSVGVVDLILCHDLPFFLVYDKRSTGV